VPRGEQIAVAVAGCHRLGDPAVEQHDLIEQLLTVLALRLAGLEQQVVVRRERWPRSSAEGGRRRLGSLVSASAVPGCGRT
jgi:hypothetical protein